MSTTWQYRPGYGWVERDAYAWTERDPRNDCPITGVDPDETGAAARELAQTEGLLPKCDCDPGEMLPCEQHMDVIAQREGASARTADDLLGVWVYDALSVDGVEVSPWGQSVIDSYEAALASNDSHGCRWLPDGDEGEGLRDDMETLRSQLESSLASLDQPVYTHWDDGYVMYRISDDSPLAGE